ncbi:hypothetical protein K435DRAFT_876486 [Dendrothele bispora CBS 962.96]|uniref:Ubiquitin-like protease family profile domain-containing protein n=1 Tax=Dendrothele bispora (strain CBS 962.96) TaxID=1314807 RepID=A0A4S8KRZ2_DENBC|nr:hypothetical protein K435DRAFT_876486 [Dendrothele bispora CBS 962.96]
MSSSPNPVLVWPNVPPDIHQSAKMTFAIPKNVKKALLPENSLSISEFLNYTFPPIAPDKTADIDIYSFFHQALPISITPENTSLLQRLPLPSPKVIHAISSVSRQQWLDGARSISYAHVENTVSYPLWVISFWNTVLENRNNVRRPWHLARTWNNKQLNSCKYPHRQTEAQVADTLLHTLSWRKKLHHGTEHPELLARFLGTERANTSLMDLMLKNIQSRVAGDITLADTYLVHPLSLLPKILEAMEDDVDSYKNRPYWRWVREIGQQVFEKGKILVTAAHLGNMSAGHGSSIDHWVSVVVDGREGRILYRDSLTTNPVIPPRLANALEVWKSTHITAHQYQPSTLPTSVQVDNYSCGFMAINALEVFVFPLIKLVDCHDVASIRLQTFNQIVSDCLDKDDDLENSTDDDSTSDIEYAPNGEKPAQPFPTSAFTFISPQSSPAARKEISAPRKRTYTKSKSTKETHKAF